MATINSNASSTPNLCSSAPTSCVVSKGSSFQQFFPWKFRIGIGSSSLCLQRRSPFRPLVQAKKETFSSLDELITKADKPVLIDFYATWCGPCQFMIPILEQVSATLKDKVQLVKIDTEKYPEIADKFKIEGLPTFILFKDGEPCDRFEGALPADKLIQRIEASLAVKS